MSQVSWARRIDLGSFIAVRVDCPKVFPGGEAMKEPSALQMTAMYFADAAEEYLNFLKKEHPEHFMESVAQAAQRKITVASLDLVAAERPDVHVYSELLIQWRDKENEMRRVVPDN